MNSSASAIARALINDPILVLADEPTGNLDEVTGLQVLKLLDRITRQSGKNMLLVTHNHEAAAFADRILYLRAGKRATNWVIDPEHFVRPYTG